MPTPPPPLPIAAAASVALLIDLPALQAEAQAQGGEIAFRRLRSGLAGERPVTRAVCLAPDGATVPSGFDQATTEDSFAGGIRFTGKVLELLGKSGQIVLAPPCAAFRELATVLRKAGHHVEIAGFLPASDDAAGTRQLGRDCLFVP